MLHVCNHVRLILDSCVGIRSPARFFESLTLRQSLTHTTTTLLYAALAPAEVALPSSSSTLQFELHQSLVWATQASFHLGSLGSCDPSDCVHK